MILQDDATQALLSSPSALFPAACPSIAQGSKRLCVSVCVCELRMWEGCVVPLRAGLRALACLPHLTPEASSLPHC